MKYIILIIISLFSTSIFASSAGITSAIEKYSTYYKYLADFNDGKIDEKSMVMGWETVYMKEPFSKMPPMYVEGDVHLLKLLIKAKEAGYSRTPDYIDAQVRDAVGFYRFDDIAYREASELYAKDLTWPDFSKYKTIEEQMGAVWGMWETAQLLLLPEPVDKFGSKVLMSKITGYVDSVYREDAAIDFYDVGTSEKSEYAFIKVKDADGLELCIFKAPVLDVSGKKKISFVVPESFNDCIEKSASVEASAFFDEGGSLASKSAIQSSANILRGEALPKLDTAAAMFSDHYLALKSAGYKVSVPSSLPTSDKLFPSFDKLDIYIHAIIAGCGAYGDILNSAESKAAYLAYATEGGPDIDPHGGRYLDYYKEVYAQLVVEIATRAEIKSAYEAVVKRSISYNDLYNWDTSVFGAGYLCDPAYYYKPSEYWVKPADIK